MCSSQDAVTITDREIQESLEVLKEHLPRDYNSLTMANLKHLSGGWGAEATAYWVKRVSSAKLLPEGQWS